MKYMFLLCGAFFLHMLLSSASLYTYDARNKARNSVTYARSQTMERADFLSRSVHQPVLTGSYRPARIIRPESFPVSQQSVSTTQAQKYEWGAALSLSSSGSLPCSGGHLFQRNVAKEALIRDLLSKSRRSKRNLVVRVAELGKRDLSAAFGAAGKRHLLRRRRHKGPKLSKAEKQVKGAKKVLDDDLGREKKDQDKAAAKALNGVNKAQSAAEKAVAHEYDNRRKYQGQDQREIQQAEANLAKVAGDKGKSGKDGKTYADALAKEQKAENNMAQLKAKGNAAMAEINSKENDELAKASKRLNEAERKAHTDQFGDKGARLAKEHPSAWQKFKHVMSKIAGPIEWAISGLSLLIPGAEEFGLARLAAKGAEMIAEKATKKGITKGAEKGIKKGTEDAIEQKLAVTAAQSESDAQIAAAKANEQKGLDQFQNAVAHVARPAAGHHKRYAQ